MRLSGSVAWETFPEDSQCSRDSAAPATTDGGGGGGPQAGSGPSLSPEAMSRLSCSQRVHPLLGGFLSPALSSSGDGVGGWCMVVSDEGPTADSAVSSRPAGGVEGPSPAWGCGHSLPEHSFCFALSTCLSDILTPISLGSANSPELR